MKKSLIILIAGLASVCNCFSQSAEKTSLLQKSKNQKTVAWVMLGVGVALDAAGIATTISNASKEVDYFFGQPQQEVSVNHGAEYALYIAGTAALATSLTLFISSKRNKTRAASLSFKSEMTPQLQSSTVHYSPVPSLSLKIKL